MCVCVRVCVICVCVFLCAWQKHGNIRVALEASHLKRDMYGVEHCNICDLTIVWKMPVNQKLLNRIGIFWYHFTPRKLLYHMISLNLGQLGCPFFFGPPCTARIISVHASIYFES